MNIRNLPSKYLLLLLSISTRYTTYHASNATLAQGPAEQEATEKEDNTHANASDSGYTIASIGALVIYKIASLGLIAMKISITDFLDEKYGTSINLNDGKSIALMAFENFIFLLLFFHMTLHKLCLWGYRSWYHQPCHDLWDDAFGAVVLYIALWFQGFFFSSLEENSMFLILSVNYEMKPIHLIGIFTALIVLIEIIFYPELATWLSRKSTERAHDESESNIDEETTREANQGAQGQPSLEAPISG